MTVVSHCSYANACVVHVNQPLSVWCFILVIPGFSILAFNFGILAFWPIQHPLSVVDFGSLFFKGQTISMLICDIKLSCKYTEHHTMTN